MHPTHLDLRLSLRKEFSRESTASPAPEPLPAPHTASNHPNTSPTPSPNPVQNQPSSPHPQAPLAPHQIPFHRESKAPVTAMLLSPCATILVTLSQEGSATAWHATTGTFIATLRDDHFLDSGVMDEFHTGAFPILLAEYHNPTSARVQTRVDSKTTTAKSTHALPKYSLSLALAGKQKDRNQWCDQEQDNAILPCEIKIFDICSGTVIARLTGHEEEIYCLKAVVFKQEPYYVSASEEGYIRKWKMSKDWTQEVSSSRFTDSANTCIAFCITFLPHTGNKYFLAACDDRISIFDFETEAVCIFFLGWDPGARSR
ncbi:hypothetical protein HDU98_005987 [Podochytrium sp. JEL0797]|nr:hypothetical protein HDU98_005987 [Podochytrium sp. JEL0797]